MTSGLFDVEWHLPVSLRVLIVVVVLGFKVILPILSAFYRFFLRPEKNLRKYGEYALVTGATDGIGLAYAEQLAKRGLNLVIVSRTPSKLEETSKALVAKNPNIKVLTVAIDFSRFDQVEQFTLAEQIKDLDIGVLVNNVGQSYEHPDYFHTLDTARVQSLLDLNIKSTTLVSHLVLPKMVKKKKGIIVNVSSAAGLFPSPLLAEYSAAKAYIDTFSRALACEYKSYGISVQVQNPLYVTTKLAKIRNASFSVPTPTAFAKAGLRAFGYDEQISPYWTHALQLALITSLPEWIAKAITFQMHLPIRARAIKKKEKEQSSKAQ